MTSKKNELKIRKGLFVTTILFALIFAGFLIYHISVHGKWSLCVAIGVLMLMMVYYAIRLFRIIKRDSSK